MKYTLLTLATMAIGFFANAQPIPTSTLTIFSEDGNKFYLILNGERQNDKPQTNLRVEELNQAYYSCKIIFEDKALPEISKGVLMVKDANNVAQDVTYKIKTDKNNGKKLLKFYSTQPVNTDFIPPSNLVVYHYGNPAPYVQSTTTTTTQVGNPGSNVNVNIGGVGVNINVNDPPFNQTTTTTTTTTTNTNPRPGQPDPRPAHHPYGDCAYSNGMLPADFEEAKKTIQNTGFDETKLSTAKEIVASNCLYADQVAQICKLFGFEETKLDFAKYAYKHTIDRSNYFKVNNVFGFSSSKEDLSTYIRENR